MRQYAYRLNRQAIGSLRWRKIHSVSFLFSHIPVLTKSIHESLACVLQHTGGNMTLDRPLNMGMVGGGPGSFIGEVHRKAARMDGGVQIVAGAFSRFPDKCRETARQLMIPPARAYSTYREMAEQERHLPEGERIDFVSIVTPNNSHFPIAKVFLEAGFHVICDKPMTFNVQEARELRALVKASGKVFGLTHNYTGYPMVKLARDIVRGGDLGEVRKIVVQYPQGWLATPLENAGQCTGRMAHGSLAERGGRSDGRYRHTCREFVGVYHRPEDHACVCGSSHVRQRPPAGR